MITKSLKGLGTRLSIKSNKSVCLNNKQSALRGLVFGQRLNGLLLNKTKCLFSSVPPKQQFLKTFLVRIEYNNPLDAYYSTYPHREEFRKQIKQLEDSNLCYIFGGDQFPLESSTLVINCDQKSLVENFLNKNAYSHNKLIKEFQIQEVEKISEEKTKKLSYFYQYL